MLYCMCHGAQARQGATIEEVPHVQEGGEPHSTHCPPVQPHMPLVEEPDDTGGRGKTTCSACRCSHLRTSQNCQAKSRTQHPLAAASGFASATSRPLSATAPLPAGPRHSSLQLP